MDWIDVGIVGTVLVGVTYLVLENRQSRKQRKVLDDKYNVSKFPVTSLMGNEYYAEIIYEHREYYRNRLYCKVYKRHFKKNGKFKDERISNRPVVFENFYYNYISVVVLSINEYEAEHQAELSKDKHENEAVIANKKLFNEWDGVIREEM
jgi:hypothetical protein